MAVAGEEHWEYRSVTVVRHDDFAVIRAIDEVEVPEKKRPNWDIQYLQLLGEDRWELCGIEPVISSGYSRHFVAYFKRLVPRFRNTITGG